MTLNFEFAYFTPKHGYVASVTAVPGSGYSIDAADTACFRVPVSFTEGYESSAQTRYISDICGHDFLSHTGRWASDSRRGISKKSENIMNEIATLRALGEELEEKGCDKADFKLTLGPSPGSFFADVKKLGEYRWENLPRDLNIAIGGEMAKRGYGKISKVTMNATGGWVMCFQEEMALMRVIKGRKRPFQFCWGGEAALPGILVSALRDGQARGAKISHISLNHQNKDEYLLIFSDGMTYVNLHLDFHDKIKPLIEMWVTKTLKKSLKWNFSYSCRCRASDQSEADAAYYHRRGQFHILRSFSNNRELSCKNIDLALDYLGEAKAQDPKSREIRSSQRLALAAARRIKKDADLEANIIKAQIGRVPQTSLINPRDSTPSGVFRNLYLQLIRSEEDYQSLEEKFLKLNLITEEWSYLLASGSSELMLIEPNFDDDDQYPESMAEVPVPMEMLGSLPSTDSSQHILAQRTVIEESIEQNAITYSQRRPYELSDQQHTPDQRNSSLFNYERSFTSQRRATDDSSRWSGIAPMTPSAASIEQNGRAQQRNSGRSSDQAITAWRRPSVFSLEQNAAAQTELHGRALGFSIVESNTLQGMTSELAADETTMVRRGSRPGEGFEFEIYGE